MKTITVRASIPVWILAFVRQSAGERSVAEALGFGLTIIMGVSPATRRQLADMLACPADDERDEIEIRFAGVDLWPDDDMPLSEIVEVAAAIVATVEHDPGARDDFLRLLHGEGGVQ